MELSIQERLKDLRVERGLTLEQLEEQVNLSKSALGSYEAKDFKDISHYAIIKAGEVLRRDRRLSAGAFSNKKITQTPILQTCVLSDDMIDLLLSGFINNRLLCEIATHDKFRELMADTEIFVDGVATKRFNDLNSSLETVRAEIISQHPNIDNDHTLRTLSAAQVGEEDFFCHITHKTWDTILKDIRKKHEQDIDSIPEDDDTLSLQKNSSNHGFLQGTI